MLESLGLSASEREGFWAAGPVGDVAARYYTAAGAPLHGAVEDRVLAVSLTDLAAIPNVVGVASGRAKTPGVLGALHGRIIDSLVCDESLARSVLSARAAPRDRPPHPWKERLMDSALIILAAVVGGWFVQMYLTYQQSMAFNAQVRGLRRAGTVSVGASGKRYRGGRAYVAVAVDDHRIVRDALVLSGWTTFARGKAVPVLVGAKANQVLGKPGLPRPLEATARGGPTGRRAARARGWSPVQRHLVRPGPVRRRLPPP